MKDGKGSGDVYGGEGKAAAENLCPICVKDGDLEQLESTKDYGCTEYVNFLLESMEGNPPYSFWYCSRCGLVYSHPMKNPTEKFYTDEMTLYEFGRALNAVMIRWPQRMFLKEPGLQGKKVLDIGCGTGAFLKACETHGCHVYGIDFNPKSIEFARTKHGLDKTYNIPVDQMRNVVAEKFDAITLFDVIEHVDDVIKLIDDVKKLLKPGGLLCLSIPNRERSIPLFHPVDLPPHHLTHWNTGSMGQFLEDRGFSVLRVCDRLNTEDVSLFLRIKMSRGLITNRISPILEKRGDEPKGEGKGDNQKALHALSLLFRVKAESTRIAAQMLFPFFRVFYPKSFHIFVLAALSTDAATSTTSSRASSFIGSP